MEDRGEINAPPAKDASSLQYDDQEKKVAETPVVTTIDPEIEKRVVRKLDLRIPTLTAFLCTFRSFWWQSDCLRTNDGDN